MLLSEELIEVASQPADPGRLRTLTLANLAAGAGHLGDAAGIIRAMPSGTVEARAYRIGAMLHARTQDDFYPQGRCHPGAVALAAILALGDRVGARFLESLAVGYRVTCLASAAYATEVQGRGMRPSPLFCALGGAAAAATAIGLDRKGVAAAVCFAAAHSGGTNQAWISGSQEWLTQLGSAARLSVEAARLVEAGFRSAPDGLDGPFGWSVAFFGDAKADKLRRGLATPQTDPIDTVAIKPYPVSGIAQVATSLAVDARSSLPEGDVSKIESVAIYMNPEEASYPGTVTSGPLLTRAAALMSVRHCVACGLLEGKVPLDRLEGPQGADLDRLVALTSVIPDACLEESGSKLRIRLGRDMVEFSGHGRTMLYPQWEDLTSDIERLALRSEAPVDMVESLFSEVAKESPDAGHLRSIIEETL